MKYLVCVLIGIFHMLSFSHAVSSIEDSTVWGWIVENDFWIQEIIREEIASQEKKNIFLWEKYSIDISNLEPALETTYPNSSFSYVWEIFGSTRQEWPKLDVTFSSVGKKQISLQILRETEDENKETLHTISLFPFVYKSSIPFIIDPGNSKEDVKNYLWSAQDAWILIVQLNKDTQEDAQSIAKSYNELKNNYQNISNYVVIWGARDFIFKSITDLQLFQKTIKSTNFVLISWYNNKILQNYIENSISGKSIVKNGFILDELYKSQILKHPNMIGKLETGLSLWAYDYTPLRSDVEISPILFVSQFINTLSNSGVKNTDIYIILLIPIFLSFVAIWKHIIWFSTLWNIIPVFLAIMFLKLGLVFSLAILAFLLVFNVIISRILSKYTLLYTPKLVCITIANILFFMLFYQSLQYFDIDFPHSWVLYIVIFFIICEKLISIITTKEFREYKKSIWGTLLVSLICFALFFFDAFLIFLFAYPEVLLVLIPLNFFLGQFTGLRITEYFRFWDIMKNIEEE